MTITRMTGSDALFESMIPDLPLIGRGKVRDIYSVDNDQQVFVDVGAPQRDYVPIEKR